LSCFSKIFATIQAQDQTKKDRLKKPTVIARLIHEFHKFVTNIGEKLFDISETFPGPEITNTDKLDALKKDYLDYVNSFYDALYKLQPNMNPELKVIQAVATKIYENYKDDDAKNKLEFFLDHFVFIVHHIAAGHGFMSPIRNWKKGMTAMP
jgi:hypothetical protein